MVYLTLFLTGLFLLSRLGEAQRRPGPATTHIPPPFQRCDPRTSLWTAWYDRDNPSGSCDCETLADLRNEHPGEICARPTAVQARVIGTTTLVGPGPDIIINTAIGFRCNNNPPWRITCTDYEVRFCCPNVCNPRTGLWTAWYDRDNPGGVCDCETLDDLRDENPGRICENPTAIQARVIGTTALASPTPDIIINNVIGFRCNNDPANNFYCKDYEVRFCCPNVCDPRTSLWTAWYDRDNPGGVCDCETLTDLRNENPGVICEDPTAVQARVINTFTLAAPASNIIIDNVVGFRCNNEPGNHCRDYEARFCCPNECDTERSLWTAWYDRDDPGGVCDCETLTDLRNEHPGVICDHPTAIQARIKGTNIPAVPGPNVLINLVLGFRCNNNPPYYCRDYEVRFCCPNECDTERSLWTAWYDRDDPGGVCDCETLTDLRNEHPGVICENPTAIQARIKGTNIPAVPGPNVLMNLVLGFRCNNNPPYYCRDYEVRFCCPNECDLRTSYWTTWYDRDNPGGVCDCETLDDLRDENPGKICENPTAIQARVIGTTALAAPTPNIIINNVIGFRCNNDPANRFYCRDYEVRFCCPRNYGG